MTEQEIGKWANPAQSSDRAWQSFFSLREMGVYYALALLVLVLAATTAYLGRPNYLSMLNMTNVFYQASLTSMMAVSMTIVLVSGNFDLSIASVAALAATVLMMTVDPLGYVPAFALAMVVAVAVGIFNGVIVQYVGINAFIVTLGTLTAVRGLVLIVSDGRSISARTDQARAAMRAFETGSIQVGYAFLAFGVILLGFGLSRVIRDRRKGFAILPQPVFMMLVGVVLCLMAIATGFDITLAKPVIYMIVFTAIVWFVLTFTNIGRRLYAVGGNSEAARLSGINVNRYKLLAFVMCSATAGLAGILFASRLRSISPSALQGSELTVIAAAILGGTSLYGGTGSVIKSVAGALVLYSLANGFNIANMGPNYQGFVEGVVVIAAAAVYTIGGRARSRK